MQKLLKSNFLLLIYLGFLTSFTFAQTYKCDPNNRPNRDNCYLQENQNVCGYYTNNCPRKICGQNHYNSCDACSNPDVLNYKIGECEPENVVFTCMEGICDPAFDAQRPLAFDPVCGLRRTRRNRILVKTFDNVCDLCDNSGFSYYQTGTCKIDREYCDQNNTDETDNDNSNDPVCASFTTEDVGTVYTTVPSASEACSDNAVEFFIEGACGPLRDNTTYCLPNSRPDICTADYNPVCGFYKNDEGVFEHKIMSNACSACADLDILYHQPGPCVFFCDPSPNVIYDCAGNFEPVCGSYEDNGEVVRVSLRNSCIGCYNIGKRIVNYTDGLCPGDEGIRCENDGGAFLEGLNPVCGYSTEDCNNDSCRETYAQPILACSNSNTIWFSLQVCPGDGGVSCDNFRTRPDQPERVYENVCGYTQQDCSDNSCRGDYGDQYDACANSNVIFFTNGPC